MKKLLIVAVFALAGCQSMWSSIKSAAAPAGGAAGGAALGMTLGPGGAIGGAAIGAIVGDGLEENAALRSGEVVGEGALKAEIERWKGRAAMASASSDAATSAKDWLKVILMWGVAGLVVAFLIRNRHNFRDLGIWNGLKHSIFGGEVGK